MSGEAIGVVMQIFHKEQCAIVLTYDVGPVLLTPLVYGETKDSCLKLGAWVTVNIGKIGHSERLSYPENCGHLKQLVQWIGHHMRPYAGNNVNTMPTVVTAEEKFVQAWSDRVQILSPMMVGAVRFVAGNGSAGIGLCPLGRVHLDIDKFPVFYKPGSAFDVILVGLIPMELNGYCWWTVKQVRDVTHVGFDGVTVRKDEARVVAWSPEDGLYHLKNDEKWFGYTFGCRDYYSNDDRDIQTNNRLQVWAGQRSNQNPYDEVRAFYVRTADAQMGERLQLDKLRVLEEEKEMRLRTLAWAQEKVEQMQAEGKAADKQRALGLIKRVVADSNIMIPLASIDRKVAEDIQELYGQITNRPQRRRSAILAKALGLGRGLTL